MAEYFELDAIVVRILAVLLACFTAGLAVIVYVVLWVRIPEQPESKSLYDVTPESAESSAFGCVDCTARDEVHVGISMIVRLAVAAGLMILFLVASIGVAPLVPGTQWWQFWPVCLLMLGLCLIIIPVPTRFEAFWHACGIVLTSASASILPMSLGIMSWGTVSCAFGSLWPLVIIAVALLVLGLYRSHDALVLGSAFCFVAFCVAGLAFCGVPGELESLFVLMPSGHSMQIAIGR